jgi:uncharacterized protein (DUF2132 family)
MSETQPNNPTHGITLKMMLEQLVDHYGWDELSHLIRINCFAENPSMKSSLNFLRKTFWARAKVEKLYLKTDLGHWKEEVDDTKKEIETKKEVDLEDKTENQAETEMKAEAEIEVETEIKVEKEVE